MKTGTQKDPAENLEREEERAIAAVVRAKMGLGDLADALRAMDDVTAKRMRMRAEQALRRYA
jgi:hypothetical protein